MMQKKTESDRIQTEEERIQIERIRAFDRELAKVDADRALASKIMYYIMGTLGCFLMLLPFGPAADPNLRVIYVLAWLFLSMAVISRMQLYIFVAGERISTMLAYVPANRALMRRVRRGYLCRYLQKLGAACFVLQQFGALVEGNWSFWNLIYPAGMILFLYLAGIAYIAQK